MGSKGNFDEKPSGLVEDSTLAVKKGKGGKRTHPYGETKLLERVEDRQDTDLSGGAL